MSNVITAVTTNKSANLVGNTNYEKILFEIEEAKNRQTLGFTITSVFFFLIEDVGMAYRAISVEEFEDTEKHIKNLALKKRGLLRLCRPRWTYFLKYGYFSNSFGPSLPKADIDDFIKTAKGKQCREPDIYCVSCTSCRGRWVPPNFRELFEQLYKKGMRERRKQMTTNTTTRITLGPKIDGSIIPQTIKIIDYKQGLQQLHELIDLIHAKITLGDSALIGKNFGFLKILGVALEAQFKLVSHLNDELISCPIAWNETTGFPSHPTLTADLQKYAEVFKPQDTVLVTALRSFDHWEPLIRETSVRCCGSISRLKTVKMDIKLNHTLKTLYNFLIFSQLVGVESVDLSYRELRDYFDFRRPSRVIDGLMIIFSREWFLRVKDGELETKEIETEKAELFNLEKFQGMIDPLNIP